MAALGFLAFTGQRAFAAVKKITPKASASDVVALVKGQMSGGPVSYSPGTLGDRLSRGERVNVLLLGYGGAGHDGAYLTDSMMLISLQGTSRMAMISVPRDSYVAIPAFEGDPGYQDRINAAFSIPLSPGEYAGHGPLKPDYPQSFEGAGKLASETVGAFTGVKIDFWVSVDFEGFRRAVDALKGIDVVNPQAFDDYEYPVGESGATKHVHFEAGRLHLNGDEALEYVRSRHADTDFGRARRQQDVIQAARQKALSVGAIPRLFALLDALSDNVRTNIPLGDFRALSDAVKKGDGAAARHLAINNVNFLYDYTSPYGEALLLPRDHTLGSIKRYMASVFPPEEALAEKGSVAFLYDGYGDFPDAQLSVISADNLGALGFTATGGPAAISPAHTQVFDHSDGKAPLTAAWLAAYYGTEVTPGTPFEGAAGQITVMLGRDFAASYASEVAPFQPPAYYRPPGYARPSHVPQRKPKR